jgi:hypothetical protein
VRAYSDPVSYSDPADVGGGGGRWFTASTADGYGCDVCHDGGTPADVKVLGLPLPGYKGGENYEVSLLWPDTTKHLALIAEFTDEKRHGAGNMALPQPLATLETERCGMAEGGFPASALNEGDEGRQFLSVIDCGAKLVRFQWTAPMAGAGTVWFNAGFVASDADGSARGDGVTLVRMPLPPLGRAPGVIHIAQGCSVLTQRVRGASWPALLIVAIPLIVVFARRRPVA